MNTIEINLSQRNKEELEHFELLLAKDRETVINEALALYFKAKKEELEAADASQTNLSFDEFWDDLEI